MLDARGTKGNKKVEPLNGKEYTRSCGSLSRQKKEFSGGAPSISTYTHTLRTLVGQGQLPIFLGTSGITITSDDWLFITVLIALLAFLVPCKMLIFQVSVVSFSTYP